MTWLVVGGAGYLGAHVVRDLAQGGYRLVVLDDLSSGVVRRIPAAVPVVISSILDLDQVITVMVEHHVTGVVNLAARKAVGESVEQPLMYYHENLHGFEVLLRACLRTGVRRVLFSSSAAVYGSPTKGRVTEQSVTRPDSPYGKTKLVGEWMMADAARAHGLTTVALRSFNVVGASGPELADHESSNLVPNVVRSVVADKPVVVFGADYSTSDGTCVRDYVHVSDVSRAYVCAVDMLESGWSGQREYNLGRGVGVSVLDVLEAVGEVAGRPVRYEVADRRPGDPAILVADPTRIRRELGWVARHDLAAMVGSAWEAEQTAAAPRYLPGQLGDRPRRDLADGREFLIEPPT